MLFSKSIIALFLISIMSVAQAADMKDIIYTKELGSCETKNLAFSAMRFYKVPLNQKYQDYDLYLRIIMFFNEDRTLSLRSTVQALLGCQTSTSGEQICSFSPLSDQWVKSTYKLDQTITIEKLGSILMTDETNVNRGFTMTFSKDFAYPHLRKESFIGGMISVNFNQNGVNTAKLCPSN